MAAAYAALASVMQIIDQIEHHPRPPISVDQDQVQSLTQNVTFLQQFLEGYSHVHNEELDALNTRITEAAYAAEDVIESHIVDQILAQSDSSGENMSSRADIYQGLQKVIQDMDLIKKEVMEIQLKMVSIHHIRQHPTSSMPAAGSSRSPSMGKNIWVGFDDLLIQLMDKLTRQTSGRQIIPIVGMGGIGKTTLAKNAYENPLIVQHFDIRAWVTISQDYSVKEILLQLLGDGSMDEMSEAKLGERLYKKLWGRRYLIILDDIWDIKAWDKVRFFFPDTNNGSGVVTTSRLSNLALQICGNSGIEMNFLDENTSWILLCKIVFGAEDGCPPELNQVGRQIAHNCKGLPLSIVVIGGLLVKSNHTREYWEYIAEHLNSIVNLEDNERCFKLLHTSYHHLPVHLKPCFLYMGIFTEDRLFRVSYLIKRWVAEGFLKPIIGKSLEEVAEEYLKDLIDRNLVLIHGLQYTRTGEMKLCHIHDLLRDLCLREADKENFLCVTKVYNSLERTKIGRRTVVHNNKSNDPVRQILEDFLTTSCPRSVICVNNSILLPNCRLLRVFEGCTDNSEHIFTDDSKDMRLRCSVNLRYLDLNGVRESLPFNLFWNLQTLIVHGEYWEGIDIWKMPVLRHVMIPEVHLPYDLFDKEDHIFVLAHLQTLSCVKNFCCSEKMAKTMPNIKKLSLFYTDGEKHCLYHLKKFESLENLKLSCFICSWGDPIHNITFPCNLKKLTLESCTLKWEDISTQIGALPLLQVLKLLGNTYLGVDQWETVEGQFLSLKSLRIWNSNLKWWITDDTHFPRLEHLDLLYLPELEEIPLCIGEMTTLLSIHLFYCKYSAVVSTKKIAEEFGNDDLIVRVIIEKGEENQHEVESLASDNFEVKIY